MKSKQLDVHGDVTYAVIFETGEEVMTGLQDFASAQKLDASRFTAIGAFRDVTLGYFDVERKEYRKIPLQEQVEVLSLVGDVSLNPEGHPQVHAHVVVGREDGTTRGGHLLEAVVRPTLEVMLVETPAALHRSFDREAGLALISI